MPMNEFDSTDEFGKFMIPPKPEGWGNLKEGGVNPEARKAMWEAAQRNWAPNPKRKGNPPEMFLNEPHFERGKILYLHGYGENKTTAYLQIPHLQHVFESAAIDVHVIEGFEVVKTHKDTFPIYPADPDYARTVLSGDLGTAYFWWQLDVPVRPSKGDPGDLWRHYSSETEEIQVGAVKRLVAHIEELDGVDGIVGFSQGGEMAYLLLQHMELLSEEHQKKLKFVGTVGSEHILSKVPCAKGKIDIPKHVSIWMAYGTNDPEGVIDVPKTYECYTELGITCEIHKMEGLGHEMPKAKREYFLMSALMLKALGRPYGTIAGKWNVDVKDPALERQLRWEREAATERERKQREKLERERILKSWAGR
jgi:hypothetical protein